MWFSILCLCGPCACSVSVEGIKIRLPGRSKIQGSLNPGNNGRRRRSIFHGVAMVDITAIPLCIVHSRASRASRISDAARKSESANLINISLRVAKWHNCRLPLFPLAATPDELKEKLYLWDTVCVIGTSFGEVGNAEEMQRDTYRRKWHYRC